MAADHPISPLREFLLGGNDPRFRRRLEIDRRLQRTPALIKKTGTRAVWKGSWLHLRRFDHEYFYERAEQGLSALYRDEEKIFSVIPVRSLVKIDRPVTLVTSGPSAHEHDWEAVRKSGRFVVVVSGGATFVRERGISPNLIVVSDPRFCPIGGYHIRDAEGVPLVIEYRGGLALAKSYPGVMENRPVSILERIDKWYGRPRISPGQLHDLNELSGSPFEFSKDGTHPNDGWSHDPSLGFFPSSTVAFVALQVLVAMGATDIEIIGMDLGGGTSIYRDALPSRLERDYQKSILPSFLTMRGALAGSNLKIRNLSPVCPLPPDIFSYDH